MVRSCPSHVSGYQEKEDKQERGWAIVDGKILVLLSLCLFLVSVVLGVHLGASYM